MAKKKSGWGWTKPYKAMAKASRTEAKARRRKEQKEHKAWQAKFKRLYP